MSTISAFRKNVKKTAATKPARLGLRTLSKDKVRVNVAHATVLLAVNSGQLKRALSKYMLGFQFTQEEKEAAFRAMGDIGYNIAMLSAQLGVKLPTATKRSKLVGTRTENLLLMDGQITDLLALVEQGGFTAPKLTTVKKMVVMPNKGGAKEEREVEVVDDEAEAKAEGERQEKMRSLLTQIVDIFWRLCFEMFQQAPAVVLDAKLERMKTEFPGIEFDVAEEEETEEPAKAS